MRQEQNGADADRWIVNTISEVFHLRFSLAKNAFDISMVLISVLLCLLNHSPFMELAWGRSFPRCCWEESSNSMNRWKAECVREADAGCPESLTA